MQVYYLSYPCKTDKRLQGWDVVYKVAPHGRLPVPNNEDYNIDPDTYDEELFQEDGQLGNFVIDLTESMGIMEVEGDERIDDEDPGDEVYDERDIELLEKVQLGVDEDILPSDEGPHYLDMHDSDDETYDPDNPTHDVYF